MSGEVWGGVGGSSGHTTPRRVTPHRHVYYNTTIGVTPHRHVYYKDISPHMQWTLVLLSEALLAHDVYVCLERPIGALSPERGGTGFRALPGAPACFLF